MSRAESAVSRPWVALPPLLIGTFTCTVLNSVVNVPMAQILTDLDVPLSRGALVVVAFNLAFAVLMPLSGWLGDRIGRRRIFCWSMAVLAIGAVGAALAPNLPVLVGFRILQGAATAPVLPGVMSLMTTMFDVDRRGRALGLWAAVNGAGQATGPALGGLLTSWLGWRSIFWPAVPMALLALAMTMWLVPHDPGRPVKLEWRGAMLLTGSAALLLGSASAIAPLTIASPLVWAGIGLGCLAAVAFLLVERGRAHAFLPPGLLLEPRYLRSAIAVITQMFCLAATLLGVPLYLVREREVSTAAAGLLVLVLPLTMAALAPLAGVATERLTPRVVMRCGLGVLCIGQAGLGSLLWLGRDADLLMVTCFVLVGAGVAFVQTPAASGATRSQAGRRGAGLGLFNLLRFGGSALGASWVAVLTGGGDRYGTVFVVCTVVVAAGLAGTFVRHDGDLPTPDAQASEAEATASA